MYTMQLWCFYLSIALSVCYCSAEEQKFVDLDFYYTTDSRLKLDDVEGGTACRNRQDYDDNWISRTKPNGFDIFPFDLESCVLDCLLKPDDFKTCVSLCMSTTRDNGGKKYTEPCSLCMADLAQCTSDKCATECIGKLSGDLYKVSCLKCNEVKCSIPFYECSGLDTTVNKFYVPPPTSNAFIIAIGIGSGVAVLVGCAVCYFCVLSGNREDSNAKILLQQALGEPPVPPSPRIGESLTQLVRAEKKERGLTVSTDGTHENQLSDHHVSFFSGVKLTVVWNFDAEHDDELTVFAGEEITGIRPVDDWWCAQKSNGVVGLIPSSYVVTDEQKRELLDGPNEVSYPNQY